MATAVTSLPGYENKINRNWFGAPIKLFYLVDIGWSLDAVLAALDSYYNP